MTGRERLLAVVTGVVVGGALLTIQVLEPAWEHWSALEEQRGALQDAVAQDRSLSEQVGTLETERKTLGGSLRPPEGVGLSPWLIAHVQDVAEGAGFKPLSIRYVSARPLDTGQPVAHRRGRRAAPPTKSPFAELRFELRARADLKEIQAFLVRLAASKRHVRVVSLALTPRRGGELEANMSLVALAPADALEEAP